MRRRVCLLQGVEGFLPGFVGAASGGCKHLGLGRLLLFGCSLRLRLFLFGRRRSHDAVLELLRQVCNLLFQLGDPVIERRRVRLHRAQTALERRILQHNAGTGRPAQLRFRSHEEFQHLHQAGHRHVL